MFYAKYAWDHITEDCNSLSFCKFLLKQNWHKNNLLLHSLFFLEKSLPMTFSTPHTLLLTSMIKLIMTMASHLPDVWSLDVFPVTVVMSVQKAAFCPATNRPAFTQSDPDVRGLHSRCAPTILQRSWLSLTHSTLELNVFWNDTVPSAGSWQIFRGNYCLHLEGLRVSQARSMHSSLLLPRLPYSLILKMEVLHSSQTLDNFYQAMPFNIPGNLAFCTGARVGEETSPWYEEHGLTNGDQSALCQNEMLQSLALQHHTSYLWAGGTQKTTGHRQYDLSSIPGRGRNFSLSLHNQTSSGTHQAHSQGVPGFVSTAAWKWLLGSV